MSDGLLLVACVLASYRLARLVAVDDITEGLRNWMTSATSRTGVWLGDLASCPWCSSPWFAGALTLALVLLGEDVPLPLLWWPAVSGGASILTSLDMKLTARG